MRISFAILAVSLALSTAAFAQTTPPVWGAPPQVTVGAGMKELIFDWEPVPGAVIYRVLRKTTDNPREYYAPIDENRWRRTRVAVPIAVHQQTWLTTKYVILACNPAGCSRSAEISPAELMLDTIGYFKASNPDANDRFGAQIAVSADGTTMAVSAPGESSNTSGVNGNPSNNSAANSGAVYVYRRNGRAWAQEAYLKAPGNHPGASFGSTTVPRMRNLALSADGSTLAVGAPGMTHVGLPRAGKVFVFSRAADNTWSVTASFTAPPARAEDNFGYSVDLSSDGRTLKSSSLLPAVGSEFEGRTHIHMHNGSTWQQYSGAMAPANPGDRCVATRLAADGRTMIARCFVPSQGNTRIVRYARQFNDTWPAVWSQTFAGWGGVRHFAIDYEARWLAVHQGPVGGIAMLHWENYQWRLDVTILPWSITGGRFGESIEFSRLGEYFAIGDPSASAHGAGVNDNAVIGTEPHGAVIVYKNRPEGIPDWFGYKIVKAPNPQVDDDFGAAVAFGGNAGWYLAVGAPQEDSAAMGVDGDQTNNTRAESGAVYLY